MRSHPDGLTRHEIFIATLAEPPLELYRNPHFVLHRYLSGKMDIPIRKCRVLLEFLACLPEQLEDVLLCYFCLRNRFLLVASLHTSARLWQVYKLFGVW